MSTGRRQQDLYRVTVASILQDAVFEAVMRRAQESPRRPGVAQCDDGRYQAVVYLRGAALERLRGDHSLDILATENISARLRGSRPQRRLH